MSAENPLPLEISPAEVKSKLDAESDFLLLDCRQPDEHAQVCIEGARLLPMSEIAGRLEEIATHRAAQIVVYCHHGGRSLRVANFLRAQGFSQAQSMSGGIDQWAVEIDPTLPRY